ncbi:MAG TPA: hypothetical protein DD618_04075 [Acholeplasmatales bacterium]|nr:hypothetical protein [Acholeplasmatales bacterium]
MSDLRLFNIKNGSIEPKQTADKPALKALVSKNAGALLGLTVIGWDLPLGGSDSEVVETLAYDENFQLTVVEYRMGKFNGTINKGLVYLDFIKNNYGKIRSFLSEKLGAELTKQIRLNPRLIVVGDDFNRYDEYAIKQMPYVIDLVKCQPYGKNFLLLEKNYQSKKVVVDEEYAFPSTIENVDLRKMIGEYILSLGDEICETITKSFIYYRKIKTFAYLLYEDGFVINLLSGGKFKAVKIRSVKDLVKNESLIEKSYDEN